MDEKFLYLLTKACDMKVIDQGSLLIFKDYLRECENKVKKNNDMIQRILGQNDQLSLTIGMVTAVVAKYVTLQEQANAEAAAASQRRSAEGTPEAAAPEMPVEPSKPPTARSFEEVTRPKRGR